jgi:hypothetical protein
LSYESALEAAGAVVHELKHFGDYQGTWYAYVTYNGETGWVSGAYGSCSGCDAFEGEFGWKDDEKPDYQQRLADFGKSYLSGIYDTQRQYDMLNPSDMWYEEEDRKAKEWIGSFLEKNEA